MNNNSVMVLNPYRKANTWVFDDAATNLKAEPFVFGIPEMIDYVINKKSIKNANKGFKLIFSENPLPKYDLKLEWSHPESGGNWYNCPQTKTIGWLCPALFKYFANAPKEIYCFIEK